MHELLSLVYMDIAILKMKDIKLTFQMETAFIMYYDIKTSNNIIKRGPSDPRSLTWVMF